MAGSGHDRRRRLAHHRRHRRLLPPDYLSRTLNNFGPAQFENDSTDGYSSTLFIDSPAIFDNKPGASFAFAEDGTNVEYSSASPAASSPTRGPDQGRHHRVQHHR